MGRPAGADYDPAAARAYKRVLHLQGNASHTDATGGIDELAREVDALADVEPAYDRAKGGSIQTRTTRYLAVWSKSSVARNTRPTSRSTSLEPVGMEHSFVADGEIHEAMATGHTPWFGTKRPLAENRTNRITAPQGGIVASGADLALYMQMMMNGEDDVLSAAGKEQMMQPASTASPYYGFGWYLNPADGSVWHSGSSPGFETLLTMVPDKNKGAVVLVNAGSGMGFGETTQLRNGITPEHWASTTTARDPDGPRRPCSCLWCSCRHLCAQHGLGVAAAAQHTRQVGAFSACSVGGSHCSRPLSQPGSFSG